LTPFDVAFEIGQDDELLDWGAVAEVALGVGMGVAPLRGGLAKEGVLDVRGTTVPLRKGREIAPSLLRQIARDISVTVDELLHRG